MKNLRSELGWIVLSLAALGGLVVIVLLFGCRSAQFHRTITEYDSLGQVKAVTDIDGRYRSGMSIKAENISFSYDPEKGGIKLNASGLNSNPVDQYQGAASLVTALSEFAKTMSSMKGLP